MIPGSPRPASNIEKIPPQDPSAEAGHVRRLSLEDLPPDALKTLKDITRSEYTPEKRYTYRGEEYIPYTDTNDERFGYVYRYDEQGNRVEVSLAELSGRRPNREFLDHEIAYSESLFRLKSSESAHWELDLSYATGLEISEIKTLNEEMELDFPGFSESWIQAGVSLARDMYIKDSSEVARDFIGKELPEFNDFEDFYAYCVSSKIVSVLFQDRREQLGDNVNAQILGGGVRHFLRKFYNSVSSEEMGINFDMSKATSYFEDLKQRYRDSVNISPAVTSLV